MEKLDENPKLQNNDKKNKPIITKNDFQTDIYKNYEVKGRKNSIDIFDF